MTQIVVPCPNARVHFVPERLLESLCFWNSTVRVVPRLGPHESGPPVVAKAPEFYGRPRGDLLMSQELKVTQQVKVSVQFQDRLGNPAKVDGVPKWFTDNSELVAIAPDADGMGVLVRPVGPLGICTVSVRADADLGEGVREIAGYVEFELVGGDAEAVKLAVGPAEDQPH